MKNWPVFPILSFILFTHTILSAQLSDDLKNLEGRWYQETRQSITYQSWQKLGENGLEGYRYSIICGDSVLLCRALLQFADEEAQLSISEEGQTPQTYTLIAHDVKKMVWKNDDPFGTPQKLEWKILNGGYATFIADGVESDFRKDIRQPIKLRIRASLGLNMNQYAQAAAPNRFLGRTNVAAVQAETQMLSGKEAAFSVGLLFPSTPLCLNFELGMAYRKVGVQAAFFDPKLSAFGDRNGVYRNFNYYFAIVPEVFVGKKRNFSVSAGFYNDLVQQRYFDGNFNSLEPNPSKSSSLHPGFDVDSEHGLILGLNYRLNWMKNYHPQLYLRYMHGLNNTHVQAISLGAAVDFEIR